jgi:uncharacterized membrane protein
MGWFWVGLMLVVAGTSFWIHDLRGVGPVEPDPSALHPHPGDAPYAIIMARRGVIIGHKLTMLGLFSGALVIAGLFTFAPGRILHRVLFGG